MPKDIDVTPEMENILKAMYDRDKNGMRIKEMEEMLKLSSRETQYFVSKLEIKRFIKKHNPPIWGRGVKMDVYDLTSEGNVYVIENLLSDENPNRES